jgi:hypothetical protein
MDTTYRILIIIPLLTISLLARAQEETLTFRDVDHHSLELYQQGDWKGLIHYSNEAFSQGIDYYFLRLRTGIAYFETKKYMKAAFHFKKALEFNEGDVVAGEYLYGCFIELNKAREAYEVYEKLPPSSRENLKKSLPDLRFAVLEAGLIEGNQMERFDTLDLDGEDNIYGETDITQDGHYFSGGLAWGFKNGAGMYGGYSQVSLNKNKIAKIGDTLSLDDQYPLRQHQVYLNGNIPLGNGYSLLPAFNWVMDRYSTVMPQLNSDSTEYLFPVENFSINSFIGYIAATKDLNILQVSIFGAISNLNEQQQYQGGFQVLVYPFGNLNFYLTSKLVSHMNDEENHFIFDQLVGFRLSRNFWAEVDAAIGRMQNYYDKNAFVVYNVTDEMKVKGSAKLIYMLYPHWMITAEYLYLLREGEYLYYSMAEDQQAVPVTVTKDFSNNIILLGFTWNF